jgi:hypothetical protein
MPKSILYRLFGWGKLPRAERPLLQAEGVQVVDEGISGAIRYDRFRAPGKRYHHKVQWFTGSLIITRQRFAAFAFTRPVINIPLDREHVSRLEYHLEAADRLLVRYHAADFNPGWSGEIELRFSTPHALEFYKQLDAIGGCDKPQSANTTARSAPFFREVQHPARWWTWGLSALLLGYLAWVMEGFHQQLFLGQPWGNKPAPDDVFIFLMIGIFLLCIGMSLVLLTMKLVVEVRDDGLFVRLFPFHLRQAKRIDLRQLQHCEAVRYRPLRDYGGWGIRQGRAGKAYSILGDRGVKLSFATGRPLLIGSQRAVELLHAIRRLTPPGHPLR